LIDLLGEDKWAEEQKVGATLSLEETIELARGIAAPTSETTATPTRGHPLSTLTSTGARDS
jgi:hypothetical protein